MIPELGQFALGLALCLALVQATLPIAGAATGRRDWMALARPAAVGQFVFVALAFLVLACLCVRWLERSKTGLYFRAIREEPEAASSIGVDVTREGVIGRLLDPRG